MNRKDLQSLANVRLREAQILFRAKEFSGAYYLAGYAVECAMKACIARQYRQHDFPDRKIVNDSYTHELQKLAKVAGISEERLQRSNEDDVFQKNWALMTLWSEESRYRATAQADCRLLLDAIMDKDHGIMPWLKKYW